MVEIYQNQNVCDKLSGNIQSGDGRTAFHSITMMNLESKNCSLIFSFFISAFILNAATYYM